ncbi:hypothetical protein BK704_11380 [[Bacillus thuringiensis] serovar konkukian]|nr:hypothetical protein BK704_11380 [[Bacillus thuringiensis] serovar konkukian]
MMMIWNQVDNVEKISIIGLNTFISEKMIDIKYKECKYHPCKNRYVDGYSYPLCVVTQTECLIFYGD